MKLNEYLSQLEVGTEVSVSDCYYDMEVYFYSMDDIDDTDIWNKSMHKLSTLLTITKDYDDNYVSVNLSEIIGNNMDKLSSTSLFIDCDLDDIMDDIECILAGNVSEKWLESFVNALV